MSDGAQKIEDDYPWLKYAVVGGVVMLLFGTGKGLHEYRRGKAKKAYFAHKKARKGLGHIGRLEDQLEHRKEVVQERREDARDSLRFAKKEAEHVRALEAKIARLKAKA